ncbi:MAG: non-heme iron oxygenase ferredoxin subunit [Ectothiorhodospiraceae bacterium]|nr:non-heme iron oxygenase ferredoxin subunit [Chromatiales bacterium]MCP5156847.1 non-heme iron oxygenase ferredoxin subunit [Ectothiorhodospiraceae bacterium]
MSDWVDVIPVVDFEPGTSQVVDVDDITVVVFNVDGEFFALEDLCSHDDSDLSSGFLHGDQIECPRHGARFCVRTGAALTPPAYEPVARIATRVHDGIVQIRDGRWD